MEFIPIEKWLQREQNDSLDFGKNEKVITKKLYFPRKYMTFNSLMPVFLIVECSLSLLALISLPKFALNTCKSAE